jgi:hypothetical protein
VANRKLAHFRSRLYKQTSASSRWPYVQRPHEPLGIAPLRLALDEEGLAADADLIAGRMRTGSASRPPWCRWRPTAPSRRSWSTPASSRLWSLDSAGKTISKDGFGGDYVLHFAVDPTSHNKLYAITFNPESKARAVLASNDTGKTWSLLSGPLN